MRPPRARAMSPIEQGATGGLSGATNRSRPWESTTVQTLANKLGKDKNIVPMMIEGPTGCILASVGEERDQKVATEALCQCHEERLRRAQSVPRQRAGQPAQPNTPQPAVARPNNEVSFGAVYEHRVNGVPKYVGATNMLPEDKFRLDRKQHVEVERMMQRRTGHSEVVWAGIGRGVVGASEMEHITNTVLNERSERQQVNKLGGVKPYSRHG